MNFEIKFPFSAAARIYENDVNPNMVIYLLIKRLHIDRYFLSRWIDRRMDKCISKYSHTLTDKNYPASGTKKRYIF